MYLINILLYMCLFHILLYTGKKYKINNNHSITPEIL